MKKIFLLITCFAFFYCAPAQKKFQGEITYKLHASSDNKPDAELKVIFGANKLKLQFKDKEEYDKSALIVILDSAATFILKPDDKVYTKKMLQVTTPSQKPESKLINGYSTTPFIPENNVLSALLGGFLGTANSVFYVADSLYYDIPAIYAGNKEFVMIKKNKIVLGAEVKIQANLFGAGDNEDQKGSLITVEAIQIKPMQVSDDEFAIPADYTNSRYVAAVTDPAMVDTVFAPPASKKTTSKKPLKSNKPKTIIKSGAVRRKE